MAEKNEGETGRMISFSDAIFAFAITLIAFNLKVPDVPRSLAGPELAQWIATLLPQLSVYVFSFIIVGIYWISHHQIFERIKRRDTALTWLNLFFLLLVSLIPLPAAVLVEYGDTFEAVALYASFMALCSLMLTAIWVYASKGRRCIDKSMGEGEIRARTYNGLASAAVFILSIPVAAFSPLLAEIVWVASFFVRRGHHFGPQNAAAKKRKP